MTDWNPDWERKLSRPPFARRRFTPAMMAEVEQRLNGGRRRDDRRNLRPAWAAVALSLLLAAGGVVAAVEMLGHQAVQTANPGQAANPDPAQPNSAQGSGQWTPAASESPSASPSESPALNLEAGDGGDTEWWSGLEPTSYDESDQTLIRFVQALMQRKLGILGGSSLETNRLWENLDDKLALARYDLSSPWIAEVHVGAVSDQADDRTYELRLLLTDSTKSEIRETLKLSIGNATHQISHVEVMEEVS